MPMQKTIQVGAQPRLLRFLQTSVGRMQETRAARLRIPQKDMTAIRLPIEIQHEDVDAAFKQRKHSGTDAANAFFQIGQVIQQNQKIPCCSSAVALDCKTFADFFGPTDLTPTRRVRCTPKCLERLV